MFLGVLGVCIALVGFGETLVEGQNAWIKPSKFALSFAVHLATLALIARWTGVEAYLFRLSAAAVIVTAWLEFALVAIQAARGVRSHFNVETPFDAAVFTAMGFGVAVLFMASVAMAYAVWRAQGQPSWAMKVSAVAILAGALGSLTAIAMVVPTPDQIAGFEQGIRISSGGRYPEGVVPHGAAVPVLGWSVEHGDWRIAHFLGVHALQALLLWGWLLRGFGPAAKNTSFVAGVVAYAAVVLFALWVARQDYGPMAVAIALLSAVIICSAVPFAAASFARAVPKSIRL